jgi:hypothetical protein
MDGQSGGRIEKLRGTWLCLCRSGLTHVQIAVTQGQYCIYRHGTPAQCVYRICQHALRSDNGPDNKSDEKTQYKRTACRGVLGVPRQPQYCCERQQGAAEQSADKYASCCHGCSIDGSCLGRRQNKNYAKYQCDYRMYDKQCFYVHHISPLCYLTWSLHHLTFFAGG